MYSDISDLKTIIWVKYMKISPSDIKSGLNKFMESSKEEQKELLKSAENNVDKILDTKSKK